MLRKEINITVVIPTYNREKTIYKCLESVVNQTYAAMEIIVVDDGSTDNTKNIIISFPSNKIRLLCQKHKGAQAARNKGIVNAKGNYIAFLDSDDEWVSDKLERQVNVLKENPNVIVYSNCFVVKEGNKRVWKTPGISGRAYKELLLHPGPTFCGIIASKDALLDIGLLDEKIPAYQEWDTSIRLAMKYELIHMEEALFFYNFHDGDTISKNGAKDIAGYEYIIKKHRKNIINAWGYQGLLGHYNLLIRKCIQNRSSKLYKYIWKLYETKLMIKIKR